MKGSTMNQIIKNEIKAISVAAILLEGSNVMAKLNDLNNELNTQLDKLSSEEILNGPNALFEFTEIIPEDVGFEFLKATEIFKNTKAFGSFCKTYINIILIYLV